MAISRVTVFDSLLRSMGVPFTGFSIAADPPAAADITIDFTPEATQEQRDAANAAREQFDWRPRRDLTPNQIANQIRDSLTTAQQNGLSRRLLARILLAFAEDAAELIRDLNLPLAVEEVDPNP